MSRSLKRCAVYTRKSSEDGLDQAFNSLDAQREACAAYVKSQTSEGWRPIRTSYDDGGHSGGTMERPALQHLLADIAGGAIDVVVVYKIDRLTRSLADFARMVELFERHEVSFVSVTQAFNTTSSMGRLTLNVLLSFAQFEREVTGERIRDKIAASKAKGMWMGGYPPLGYDLPAPGSRALVLNEAEAETVRTIFRTYLALGSAHALQRWLDERSVRSKMHRSRSGKTSGGQPFSRGALYRILRNPIYLGRIVHRGVAHDGMHTAIVDADLFAAVQTRIDANARRHGARTDHIARAPLKGRIFDADGQPMSPTIAYGKRGKIYRYYVSAPLQQGKRRHPHDDAIRRVSADPLEALLRETSDRLVPSGSAHPLDRVLRIEVHAGSLQILMPLQHLPAIRGRLALGEQAEPDPVDPSRLRLTLPVRVRFHGGRTTIKGGAVPAAKPDPTLVKALRDGHAMVDRDAAGLPVLAAAPATPWRRRLVRLAFLAPALQRAILDGTQPPSLTLADLMNASPALLWSEQMQHLVGKFGG